MRIVGHGNTTNEWTSITETPVLGADGSGGGGDCAVPADVLDLSNWYIGAHVGEDGFVSRSSIQDVPVAELPIRLGQFLKLAGLAEHGAHARELVETDQVQVNGQVEARRGAQLQFGDVVAVAGQQARPVR